MVWQKEFLGILGQEGMTLGQKWAIYIFPNPARHYNFLCFTFHNISYWLRDYQFCCDGIIN